MGGHLLTTVVEYDEPRAGGALVDGADKDWWRHGFLESAGEQRSEQAENNPTGLSGCLRDDARRLGALDKRGWEKKIKLRIK